MLYISDDLCNGRMVENLILYPPKILTSIDISLLDSNRI